MLVRATVSTPLVTDTFVFPVDKDQSSATVRWFLQEVHRRYSEWHFFKVHSFTFDGVDEESIDESQPLLPFLNLLPKLRNVAHEEEKKAETSPALRLSLSPEEQKAQPGQAEEEDEPTEKKPQGDREKEAEAVEPSGARIGVVEEGLPEKEEEEEEEEEEERAKQNQDDNANLVRKVWSSSSRKGGRPRGVTPPLSAREVRCVVVESQESIAKRAEEERLAEEARRRAEAEAARLRAERQAAMRALVRKAHCWELEPAGGFLDVPLDKSGLVVRNKGSLDQWCVIRYAYPIVASYQQFFFQVQIESLPETTNTWRVCIGAVPMQFNPQADRHWVGAQHSWGYIAGTGGKCHNSGKSTTYGEGYGESDKIGCLLDFVHGTIEYFKNGKSQGVAYENLRGPVYPAISLTAKNAIVRLCDPEEGVPEKYAALQRSNMAKERERRVQWDEVLSSECQEAQRREWDESRLNSWSGTFSHACDEAVFLSRHQGRFVDATNQGSDDKWRVARAVGLLHTGVHGFEVEVIRDCKTSNTWRLCVGVVPAHFDAAAERIWVGAQSSWAYIAGTGGKCFNSGQSTAYGERFGAGDRVQVVCDFPRGALEFFKNGDSQGVAYETLEGPVFPAVSMTAARTRVRLHPLSDQRAEELIRAGQRKRQRLQDIMARSGNLWDAHKCGNGLRVSECGLIVENTGTGDKWRACAAVLPFQSGRRYFEVEIVAATPTTNSWQVCVGVVNKQFDFAHKKAWVGAQHSWGYIAGTGGKCHHSGKSATFGQKFGQGDRIGVLMDFDNHTLEFFKNGLPQGEAFNDLYGPVFAAVSMTGKGAKVLLDANVENSKMEELFLFQ